MALYIFFFIFLEKNLQAAKLIMTTRFDKERRNYKQMFEEKLNQLLQSDRTQNIIQQFKLKDYQFMMAKPKHLQSVMNLAVKSWKKNNPAVILFGLTEKDVYTIWAPPIKAKIAAGRCLIAIDKSTCIYVEIILIYDLLIMSI